MDHGEAEAPAPHPDQDQERQQDQDFAADRERVGLPEEARLVETPRHRDERLPGRLQVGGIEGPERGDAEGRGRVDAQPVEEDV